MASEEAYKEFNKIDKSKFDYLINYLKNKLEVKFVLGKIVNGQDNRVYHAFNSTLRLSYMSLVSNIGNLELKVWGKDSEEVLNNLTKLIEKK